MVDEFLTAIIRKILDDNEIVISDETRLSEDLGLSSFQTMMLVVEIESEINEMLNYSDLAGIKTIADIKNIINKYF